MNSRRREKYANIEYRLHRRIRYSDHTIRYASRNLQYSRRCLEQASRIKQGTRPIKTMRPTS